MLCAPGKPAKLNYIAEHGSSNAVKQHKRLTEHGQSTHNYCSISTLLNLGFKN